MHTKSKPLNFRYGYHFSNGIPGDFGWTSPNECRDHYLSVDHYSAPNHCGGWQRTPLCIGSHRKMAKWRTLDGHNTTRKTQVKDIGVWEPRSQRCESHSCPSNKYLIITGDKCHFWPFVGEKISLKTLYLIISKVVVASAWLAIFRPAEDEVFWFKQELIEGSHMACVIHVTPDDPNSPFLAL